ncbi:uncharacterized mitochondrial protein AtMg00820-like [Helianthus annuus]|uniref:uncharacterized mitochondrial protein AtMg00820-like n=1 Tax=Helianthus annuus TaxID=4232 RepID=UPI000B8FAAA5|nr:uncharacterized mitochondrial protein AtMg00820-like [Helianthus annuus]
MSGIHKPKQHFNLNTSSSPLISPIPKNPSKALSNPDWKNAMNDEYRALIENKTWELVPKKLDMNIVRTMWVFRHKKKADGTLERYKARLVCDGRSQQVGVDYGKTFSPVVKPTTIRTVLTLALSNSWPIQQLDVKMLFSMDIFRRRSLCTNLWGVEIQIIHNMCVYSRSLYTALNKHRVHGINFSPSMFQKWGFDIANVIAHYLSSKKTFTWP